jgi:hypothetical protein
VLHGRFKKYWETKVTGLTVAALRQQGGNRRLFSEQRHWSNNLVRRCFQLVEPLKVPLNPSGETKETTRGYTNEILPVDDW